MKKITEKQKMINKITNNKLTADEIGEILNYISTIENDYKAVFSKLKNKIIDDLNDTKNLLY